MDDKVAGPSKRKKSKKRNVWSTPMIELLLEVWEDKISELRGTRKNSHVYDEIRQIIAENGYSVSSEEVKIRINNLTARYRKEKALVGSSGGSPSEWPLYEKVNRILGSFRIHNVASVVEDSIVEEGEEYPSEEFLEDNLTQTETQTSTVPETQALPPPSPSMTERPSSKKKLMTAQSQMLEEFKRNNAQVEADLERMREVDETLLKLESERNDILKGMVTSSKEVNEALVKFLTR